MALLRALQMNEGDLNLYTDHHNIWKLFQKPVEAWEGIANSDLWEEVKQHLARRPTAVTVRKVKSHTTIDQLMEGLIPVHYYFGNMIADALAGKAADENQHQPQDLATIDYLDALAWTVLKRLVAVNRLCAEETKDQLKEMKKQRAAAEAPVVKPRAMRPVLKQLRQQGHDVHKRTSNRWGCLICGVHHQDRYLRRWLALGACKGDKHHKATTTSPTQDPAAAGSTGAGTAEAAATTPEIIIGHQRIHHTHRLEYTKGLSWCRKCGQIASQKAQKLVLERKEPTERGQRNLRALLQGKPPPGRAWPQERMLT